MALQFRLIPSRRCIPSLAINRPQITSGRSNRSRAISNSLRNHQAIPMGKVMVQLTGHIRVTQPQSLRQARLSRHGLKLRAGLKLV